MTGGEPSFRRHEGLALVAVMWIIAALAILAAGLATATRAEVRTAQLTRAIAEVAALGDAATHLAALELGASPDRRHRFLVRSYGFDGRSIRVSVVPAAGLIDINHAPEALLQALLVHAGALDARTAEVLARRIVDWRTPILEREVPANVANDVSLRPRHGPYEYPEDLLQLPGLSYDAYERIRSLVTVQGGSVGVDPMAAPIGVLTVLAGGDVALAQQFAANRDAGLSNGAAASLTSPHASASRTSVYRVDAFVEAGGRRYVRTRWVDLARAGADGSAWRTLRVEPVSGVGGRGSDDEL